MSVLMVATAAAVVVLGGACRKTEPAAPALATPSITIDHPRAPLGSPIDITYRFAVAPGAHIAQDYRVMVHVVDADGELMWTDDHNPPVPSTQWKPGQTVEYTRTVFVPVYPYVGDAAVQVGLYSMKDQKRATLTGEDVGQKAYKVGTIQLLPQTENVFVVFKDGWHPAEVAEHNSMVEWQWTKKDATLAFKNPKKDSTVYLDLDRPGAAFADSQQVTLSIDGNLVDQFQIKPDERVLRKVAVSAAQLGPAEMVELHIGVDKTFVPALLPAANSKDPRELGVRVFHAFVEPK
jgi:hypothetical protein